MCSSQPRCCCCCVQEPRSSLWRSPRGAGPAEVCWLNVFWGKVLCLCCLQETPKGAGPAKVCCCTVVCCCTAQRPIALSLLSAGAQEYPVEEPQGCRGRWPCRGVLLSTCGGALGVLALQIAELCVVVALFGDKRCWIFVVCRSPRAPRGGAPGVPGGLALQRCVVAGVVSPRGASPGVALL